MIIISAVAEKIITQNSISNNTLDKLKEFANHVIFKANMKSPHRQLLVYITL